MSTAWRAVEAANSDFPGGLPDIRWRAHVALWAAKHAMRLDGDLVECGVFTGILTTLICNSISDFGVKRYWLFDSFNGIPEATLTGIERRNAEALNATYYKRVNAEQIVRAATKHVEQIRIVKGILPDSLDQADLVKISYLSIDLNNAPAEIAVIERLWDRIVPGAVIVLDDYGFSGHRLQHNAWDEFAAARGVPIATLPTGQGLIIRSAGAS